MTSFEVVMKYMSAVMAALYIILGGVLIWKGNEFTALGPTYSIMVGIVIIAYGLFRGYNAYRKNQRYRE